MYGIGKTLTDCKKPWHIIIIPMKKKRKKSTKISAEINNTRNNGKKYKGYFGGLVGLF